MIYGQVFRRDEIKGPHPKLLDAPFRHYRSHRGIDIYCPPAEINHHVCWRREQIWRTPYCPSHIGSVVAPLRSRPVLRTHVIACHTTALVEAKEQGGHVVVLELKGVNRIGLYCSCNGTDSQFGKRAIEV